MTDITVYHNRKLNLSTGGKAKPPHSLTGGRRPQLNNIAQSTSRLPRASGVVPGTSRNVSGPVRNISYSASKLRTASLVNSITLVHRKLKHLNYNITELLHTNLNCYHPGLTFKLNLSSFWLHFVALQ